ncbi:hypothetical protein ACFL6S_25455 [Candidatus Poribacteria bacterium]
MGTIVFSTLVLCHLVFLYKLIDKVPDESKTFVAKLTQLIPDFAGKNPDLRCFGFLACVMVFLSCLIIVIFG